MGMDWSELNLSAPLQINGDTDSDNDGLTDWEEINSEFLENNGIELKDNEYISEEQLPSVWYMLKSKYNYVPFRYINSNNFEVFEILNKIKVLPVNSNPLKESSADDGVNDFDKLKPECIFDKYKSNYYNENDTYYNYYNDSKYYYEHLDERYKQKDAFKAYTVESLFPELKDEILNNKSNSVYLKVSGNDITICPKIYFSGEYDEYADENLKMDHEMSKEIYENLKRIHGNDVKLSDVFIDGLENRWGKNVSGTIFDFYPGMEIKTHVAAEVLDSEPKETENNYYINVNIICDGGISTAGLIENFNTNKGIGMYTAQDIKYGGYEIDVFEGICAHEFGHILNLYDAYPGANNDFTLIYHEDINNELFFKSNTYGVEGGGEIMKNNSDVLPNDIEMAIYGIGENKVQHFTSFYDRNISSAIRQKEIYLYSNGECYENPPYILNAPYKWVNEKGYILAKACKKTADVNGVELKYYKENKSDATICIYGISDASYNGEVRIPDEIDGYKVVRISDGAFANSNISSIVFEKPENILGIGQRSFYNCENLESINLPDNINVILPSAFQNCTKLTSVKIPVGTKTIGNSAFSNCYSLSNVTIPESVEKIDWAAFSATAIETIYIPESVKIMDESAFDNCDSLKFIEVDNNNSICSSEDGVLFDKNKTRLIQYPVNNDMEEYAIPNGVETIRGGAFMGSSKLKSVTIPESVKKIEYYAFSNCSNLSNVIISEGVEEIGWSAFEATALTEIVIPSSVKIMSLYVFLNCNSLTNVIFKSNDPSGYSDSIFYMCTNNIYVHVPYDENNLCFNLYSNLFEKSQNIHVTCD